MTSKSEKFALYSNFSGSIKNKNAAPTSTQRRYAKRKRPEGVGRVVQLGDGVETVQVLSDAQIRVEKKKRGGRLPFGYGTKFYQESLARHEAHKAEHRAEREARAEALAERTALTDKQREAVDTFIKIHVEGHPVDMRGRLLEPEAAN